MICVGPRQTTVRSDLTRQIPLLILDNNSPHLGRRVLALPHKTVFMRFEGTIIYWNDERGFGFIEPAEGGQHVFVHVKAFASLSGRPQFNQQVSFEVARGPQGKTRATCVMPTQAVRSQPLSGMLSTPAEPGLATLLVIPIFMVGYAVVDVLWSPHRGIAAVYGGASVLTFINYALDKYAARRGAWRTPESKLHMLALGCGWPGALFAQQILRHKSSKRKFRSVFWGTVALNVVALVVLSSPFGRSLCWGLLKATARTADRAYGN